MNRSVPSGAGFETIAADVFRKAGWRIRHAPSAGDLRADLLVEDGSKKYVVEVKSASEGRGDRLIPLLSQAILQAQALARELSGRVAPLAVVAAKRVPASVADQIKRFAERYAPGVAIGIIDAEGFRWFTGPGLDGLNASPAFRARRIVSPPHLPDLFSDLNQWMLKVLLGQHLPQTLISVPREPIRNASHLAAVAGVSVMSASRFLNQLANEKFLDEQSEHPRVTRLKELLERWVSANRRMSRDVPARWIIRKDEKQFFADLASGRIRKPQSRLCIGLFAAADALGFGFVRGVSSYLYLERLDFEELQKLGLSLDDADRRPGFSLRVPSNREAVFRAAVLRDGLPVSDVLQVWLDTSAHPSRGREQADEIGKRALKPLFEKHP